MGTGDWGKGRPTRRTPLNTPCSVQLGIMLLIVVAMIAWLCQ